MDKKRAKELAEEVKKILNIAETFKIGEKELEEEDKVPTSENVKKEEVEVEVEEKEHARLEKEEEEGEVENKETKRDAESDEDDNFQILDVFGDDEPEALKLTPEDEEKEAKNIEASVFVGPVLNVEGTVGTAIVSTKNSSKKSGTRSSGNVTAALVAPKALLAKMCKRKWLAPRYDRLKTDDKKTIRYSVTIERFFRGQSIFENQRYLHKRSPLERQMVMNRTVGGRA